MFPINAILFEPEALYTKKNPKMKSKPIASAVKVAETATGATQQEAAQFLQAAAQQDLTPQTTLTGVLAEEVGTGHQ